MMTWKTNSDTIPLHTILIISDQPGSVAIWDTLFSQRNCIVLFESNVSDALQSARLVCPSLTLIDMKLSKSERDSLLSGLRSASRGPILVLVSADTVEQVLEANRFGADECLVKPVNPAVLVVKAMAWLGRGQRMERIPATAGVGVAL